MEIFSFSGRHWPVESSSSNDPLTWPLMAVGTGRCDMRNESPHRSPSIFEVIYKISKPPTIPYHAILFHTIHHFSEDLRLWQLVQPKKRSPFCGGRRVRLRLFAEAGGPIVLHRILLLGPRPVSCSVSACVSHIIDQVLQVGFKCFKISSKLQISIPIQL